MNEIEQKKLASKIVLKAIKECNEKGIDPYPTDFKPSHSTILTSALKRKTS